MVRDVDAASLREALPGLLFRRLRRKKKRGATGTQSLTGRPSTIPGLRGRDPSATSGSHKSMRDDTVRQETRASDED